LELDDVVYPFEDLNNENDEIAFEPGPYPVHDLPSIAYYDVDPSRNFIRVFFGIDYLNHNNYRI